MQRKTTELENQQLRLKDLAADLCRVEEMERRRISTQLHDQIGQTLIFTKIKLARLAQEIHSDLAADLRDALAALDSAIKGVRTLTVQVSPPLLYEVGLEAALDELGESISTEHGLKVTLRTGEAPLALSEDERIVLYQSVRELLVNVVKHSGSRTARVTFFTEDGQRCVQVADEGCGFDIIASERRGFGLFNIRERIKRLGGDCTIDSSPHHGTIVTLRLPGISH